MKSVKIRFSIIGPFLACAILVSASAVSSQSIRGLLPTDLSSIKDVSDAQISPDGSSVVYVVSEAAPDRSRMVSHLWIVPTKGGEAKRESKRLTAGDASESTPRWSPDGKWIAFYSNRDKQNGLWIVAPEGGEARLITHSLRTNFHLKGAGESFTWAPDSKRIAFLSATEILNQAPPPPPPTDPKLAGLPPQVFRPLNREEIEKLPVEVREMIFRAQGQLFGQKPSSPVENAISVLPDDPRVITRLQYKSRTSFSDNFRSHIFAVDIETRQLRQLTEGLFYEHSINWSPKGDEIVFVSNHEPDPDRINNTDIFTVNVNSFAIRQLTKTKGCEWQPVFSPDGSEIAYLATKREVTTIDSVAEDSHAYIISAQGGESVEVGRNLDKRVSAIKWWRDGKKVAFAISNKGYTALILADRNQEMALLERAFGLDAQITSFTIGQKEEIVYAANDVTHPSEVYAQSAVLHTTQNHVKLGNAKQLSKVNEALCATLRLLPMTEFRFKNDGFEVEGWVISPVNFDEKKKHPVILSVHGGPHGMHGYSFNPTV